jgi:hypothetical protein
MTSRALSFTVYGTPLPKGGVRPVPIREKHSDGSFQTVGSRLVDDTKSRPWSALIKDAAREAIRARCPEAPSKVWFVEEALDVRVVFWMPRPASEPKRRVTAPIRRPDLDKLTRVKDALTGVVWDDDCRVVEEHLYKAYVWPGEMPRADIHVTLADLTAWPWTPAQAIRPLLREQWTAVPPLFADGRL